MESLAKVSAVLAVLASLSLVVQSQNYYPSQGAQHQQYEKIVEHITPISSSNFFPAVPVYSSPVNSYGYPASYYRSVPASGGCQKSARPTRDLYLRPYPGRAQQYQGDSGQWYPSSPMGYQPAMRSSPSHWMMQPEQQQQYFQQYYYQDEPAARSSKTFGVFRDFLPNIFGNGDNENIQHDMPLEVPQNYNSVPPIPASSSAPIQTYY